MLRAAVAAGALLAASAASAATIADFSLNGDLNNAAGGAITLTNNGSLGANGITFDANGGPTLNNLGVLSAYTLETRFSFSDIGGYRKIADFFGRGFDHGLYAYGDTLGFYGYSNSFSGGAVFDAGEFVTLTLARSATGLLTGSINGTQQFSFTDSSNFAVIDGALHLFRDDTYTGGSEASRGFVDYIRLADAGGFTPAPGAGAVPEPATWAMMLLGFFGLGATLRARRGGRQQGSAALAA